MPPTAMPSVSPPKDVPEQMEKQEVAPTEPVESEQPNEATTGEPDSTPLTTPTSTNVKTHTKIPTSCAATPAAFKRRQTTRELVIQSPTDRIFSPCSQKLLQKHKKPTKEDLGM